MVEGRTPERKLQESFLIQMGCGDVAHASIAEDAWVRIKRSAVDCVVSSWNLGPDMNGLALLKIVRADESLKMLPFVMCLMEATRGRVLAAGQAGVTDVIIRPYSMETFENKVLNALEPEEDPKVRQAKKLFDQGERLLKKGELEKAADSFGRVLDLFENAEVYYNLGYIKTSQGRYEEAIMAFRKAAQIDDAFAEAYRKMGEVFAKLGRKEEAVECLNKAADIFLEKRMEADAEEALQDVLRLSPNTPNVFNSLGIVYRRQGRLPEAARMLYKALKVSPADEHIHYNLARVLTSENRYDEATKILKTALSLSPDFDEAANLLKSIELGQTNA